MTLLASIRECVRERRLPWALRWVHYLSLRHPVTSCRLIASSVGEQPEFPRLSLQLFGESLLTETLACASMAGMRPFLAFGTLLGHHRDDGFIEHDCDIDFGLLEVDIAKVASLERLMNERGYVTRLRTDFEVSFYLPHLPTLLVDFFFFFRNGQQCRYFDNREDGAYAYAFPASAFEPLVQTRFLGRIPVHVPAGIEQFLEASYGEWRIPKREFDNVHDHPNLEVVERGDR